MDLSALLKGHYSIFFIQEIYQLNIRIMLLFLTLSYELGKDTFLILRIKNYRLLDYDSFPLFMNCLVSRSNTKSTLKYKVKYFIL
ncbi:hypothetical protein AsAng_0026300 [Aureispira anguillae]|uniref:Uncharacterized protein n=1 Tax=Aureispira anguillae TaxID=2864201 RepID=A0A916DSJ1_9BACT|nr:hypothetical protein AsAng_0026300 [Aureispira anguillae]